MRKNQIWSLVELNGDHADKAEHLMSEFSISRVLADLLIKRNLIDAKKVRDFLTPAYERLSEPFLIPGMQAAVPRIQAAIKNKERVVIYGDYDADGICSIVVLKEALELLISGIECYIPNPFDEGYGLNSEAIQMISEQGCQLLITVDCGISSIEEVELANRLGMDVIITDHHQPGGVLPEAVAIVNPKLDDSTDKNDLAGVGVAFQLVRALAQCYEMINPREYLELVALATVADIVPLVGDNRILVREGMLQLKETNRLGLKALLEIAKLSGKDLQYWHIGYVLAPRLNAAGRLAEARSAVELLLSRSEMEARSLAEKLSILNSTRQGIERVIYDEACNEAMGWVEQGDSVLVMAREGWHQGVLGIVASRLVETFGRPVLLVSLDGEQGKGSGRAVPGFNLFKSLQACQQYLSKFGGHKLAAGVALHKSQIDSLREALNELAANAWDDPDEGQKITIDSVINSKQVDFQLLREIEQMEPFGLGNPSPLFMLRQATIIKPWRVGKKQEHLKFSVESDGKPMDAIGFGMGDLTDLLSANQFYDLVFEPVLNSFKGKDNVQLKVCDLKISDDPFNPTLFNDYRNSKRTQSVFESLESSIKKVINNGNPVLVMYPSVRCLNKHLLGLSNIFPPRLLAPVHGCIGEIERNRNIEALRNGNRRVFLTTSCFFRTKLGKMNLNSGLEGIALWSEDLSSHEALSWQRFDREVISPVLLQEKQIDYEEIGSGRRIIYTNRKATLRRLYKPGYTTEAGIEDIGYRFRSREEFMLKETGCHFWDGAFGGGLPRIEANEFILGDVPFGNYEIDNCLAQLVELPSMVYRLFSDKDIEWNRGFLSQLFPDYEALLVLYQKLLSRDKAVCSFLDKAISNPKADALQGGSGLALSSGLRVLSEIGLIRKTNGSWEVKSCDFYVSELAESPYYQEGLEEKSLFDNWVTMHSLKEC
ncbi:MAG: single-stranded-DNA-specific exonuclease RecJ [Syntrophomonadaceae bacterium]|nr:single-stranded-DNA-specific exonuclease RecJ [Syntrophomonadaceae bacterium]